jgi:glutathione synthase/RimK-type ligase-like ATP-grasp enzyme
MKTIIGLTDYKGKFGSKHFDNPYRSGLDKKFLKTLFEQAGYNLIFYRFDEIITKNIPITDIPVIYTSSEDDGYFYKSYIEDIIYSLELAGARIIPKYQYLKANNNKVFMELLRRNCKSKNVNSIKSLPFGCLEELNKNIDLISYPIVIKKAEGASGSGVYKAENKEELISKIKKISRSKNLRFEIRDLLRSFRHKNYIRESRYRRKYIIQEFIPNLLNDWKVYIMGKRYYIFYRPIFKHRGFRASGGGYDNYLYDENAPKPEGIFDFAKELVTLFDCPHFSLDIAFDGEKFHLIEFQFLYFGTAGIPYSKGYYANTNNTWVFIEDNSSIESVYSESIINFLSHS